MMIDNIDLAFAEAKLYGRIYMFHLLILGRNLSVAAYDAIQAKSS